VHPLRARAVRAARSDGLSTMRTGLAMGIATLSARSDDWAAMTRPDRRPERWEGPVLGSAAHR